MLQRRQKSKIYQKLSCLSATFKTIYYNIQNKKFEREVYALNRFVTSGSICFDIGAGYGKYTFMLSKIVGNTGHIYSFEPGNYSYRVLSNIVKFHRLKNVTLVKKALLDKKGFSTLAIPIKESGKLGKGIAYVCSNFDPGFVYEKVEQTTLDDYCLENGISNIDFIKCDVEGAELLVLKGGKSCIERYKPVILCEVIKEFLDRFGLNLSDIHNFINQINYKIFILKDDRFEKIDQITQNHNYFFIHTAKTFILS